MPDGPLQLGRNFLANGAIDDRSAIEHGLDFAAAAIHGAILGVEAEAEGNMAISAEAITRALDRFLDDVESLSNAATAKLYAEQIRKVLDARCK